MIVYRLYPTAGPGRATEVYVGVWDPAYAWVRAFASWCGVFDRGEQSVAVFRTPRTARADAWAYAFAAAGRPVVLKNHSPIWVHPARFTAPQVPPCDRRRP